ncbi:MAG TPA: hypothetical protein VFZ61_28010 [Polyangiales bacterium]
MAQVEVSHIRAAKERLEQIWPGNCRPALALEVAQIMADAEQRGREAGRAEERADVIATIERCRSIVTAAGLGRPGPLMQGRALALNELHGIIGSGVHVGTARQQGGG